MNISNPKARILHVGNLLLMAIAFACATNRDCLAADDYPIAGSPQIQQKIEEVVQYRGSRTDFGKEHLSALSALETLRDRSSAVDAPKLVREILYYHNHADDLRGRMVSMKLLDELEISKVAMLQAVLPFIPMIENNYAPGSPLSRLTAEVERLLSRVEGDNSRWPKLPNYRIHSALISAQKGDPPSHLVKYMFRRSPPTALEAFRPIYLRDLDDFDAIRQLAWANHIVSSTIWRKRMAFPAEFKQIAPTAIEQLERLSHHDQWWVRLYVAEVVKQHPELRTEEVMERLRKDEHRLVRETLAGEPQP